MITYRQAKRRHAMLKHAIVESDARDIAEQLYAGVTGVGPTDTPLVHAVADTTPREYAALVMSDDIAAAFACASMAEAFGAERPREPHELRKLAHRGWAIFAHHAEHAADVQRAAGADLSSAWPILQRVTELKPDPAKMRRIAELAGRMLVALRGVRERRAANQPEEIVGVERGANIPALLPTEYALLGLAVTEREGYRRIAEETAEQYEKRGSERKTRGPLVLVVDESGSMMAPGHEARNDWAKAAGVALTRIAWEDKRPVVWVHFSVATRVQVLMPADYAGLTEAQTSFLDGGTDIRTALDVAGDEVETLAARGFEGGDVVLISDGNASEAAGPLEPAIDAIERRGSRLWGVAIEASWSDALKARCAKHVRLTAADIHRADAVLAAAGAVEA